MTIRWATDADIPRVARYLAGALAGGGPERYRRYLDYAWLPAPPDRGVVIEDGDRVVGYLGAIYADRVIAGASVRTCNIHSVAVDESARAHTLRAFSLLLGRKQLTYTCFSPSPQIAQILDFWKFAHRPGDRVIIPATGLLHGLARRALGRVRVATSPAALDAILDRAGRQLAADHRPYRLAQLVLSRGDRHCHILAGRRGRGPKVFAEILHASDPALLLAELSAVQLPLLRLLGCALIGIDRAWAPHPPRLSARYTKLRPAYVRSPTLPLDAVDFAYSEFAPMFG